MARLTQHWHRIEVTGKGQFPIDMLRHDQCFPIFESDSEIIRNSLAVRGRSIGPQIIALGSWHPSRWEPTKDRWASFGWVVTHHEVMR